MTTATRVQAIRHERSARWAIGLLLAVCLVARTGFVLIAYRHTLKGAEAHPWLFVEQDTTGYMIRALDLVQGRGFMAHPPESRRTPLYPLILAGMVRACGLQHLDVNRLRPENAGAWLIFRSPLWMPMALLHHALGMLTTLMVFLIARELTGSVAAAWAGAMALESSPVRLATDTVMLPYVVMGFWLILCVWTFLRAVRMRRLGWLAAAGASLCLATLAQPMPLYLWPGFLALILLFWRGQRLALAGLIFCAAATALPMAWLVRNGWLSGVYRYSMNGDASLFQLKVPLALMERDRISFAEAEERLVAESERRIARAERRLGRPLNGFEWERERGAVAVDFIRSHPLSYVSSMVRGVPGLLFDQAGRRTGVYDRGLMACLLALAVVAMARFARLRAPHSIPREWHSLLLLGGLVGYLTVLTVPALPGYVRFKAVLMPYLCILAAVGLDQVARWRARSAPVTASAVGRA
ncbi:MAG: glycosyltransferase family 39 protein [Candidatus Omnitrophica bacterium]|nr:glycosyltransferase family 39 protein [Candidatus Omnitrophota bacterium]